MSKSDIELNAIVLATYTGLIARAPGRINAPFIWLEANRLACEIVNNSHTYYVASGEVRKE